MEAKKLLIAFHTFEISAGSDPVVGCRLDTLVCFGGEFA
jgi:hypothetical protein